MKGKILGFAIALLSVATVGVVQLVANAAVDHTRDCDQYAVVYCGTLTPQEARNKYDQASIIFGHFGIKKSEISGNFVSGVVYQDGRVVTNSGKVVATGARTAIRNMSGGNKIPGTNAAVYPTSRMGSAQTAMIKLDSNGRFLFAIMKPCGNPVVATPTQPKPVAKCDNLSVDKLERTRFRFSAKAEAKYGAHIRSYTYEVFHKGHRVLKKTIQKAHYVYNAPEAGDYRVRVTVNTSEGPKSGPDCVKQFTVRVQPAVECKDLRVAALTRTQFRFHAKADATRARISGYKFEVQKNGTVIHTKIVKSTKEAVDYIYNQSTVGSYSVRVTVLSNLAPVSGPNCVKSFEVTQLPPTAACTDLVLTKLSDNRYRFTAHAAVSNGATIDGYVFTVSRNGHVIATIPVDSNTSPASTEYTAPAAGTYTVVATVKTSLGDRSGPDCTSSFSVPPQPESPDVKITKLVDGVKYKQVGVNVEFTYQIRVTNTGNVDLEDVDVTDTPEQGITLISASAGTVTDNTWMYTIPMLGVGEHMDFTITAKVPQFLAGRLTNTVCVDASEVPGNPDDCDHADVQVPKEGYIIVCVIDTGEIKQIKESEFDKNKHTTDFSKCEETPMPSELPQTGASDTALQLIGLTSFAGSSMYYLASRRLQN